MESPVTTFVTHASDETATEAGIAKYQGRLEKLVRAYFPIPRTDVIRFVVRRPQTQQNPAA